MAMASDTSALTLRRMRTMMYGLYFDVTETCMNLVSIKLQNKYDTKTVASFIMSGYVLAIGWMSFRAGFIQGYNKKSDKLSVAYEPTATIVHEEVQYVPLGHHAKFRCGVYDDFELLAGQSTWRMTESRNRTNYVQIDRLNRLLSLEEGDWKGFRISLANDTRFAYVYAVDRKMNGSSIECSVNPGFANDKRQSEWKLIHRIEIVVQDCSNNLEVGTISANRLNPCRYGSCRISKDDNIEVLECLCVEQYTGLFCDQPVQGAVLCEILYFLPIFSLLAVLFLVCCFHKRLGSIGAKERPMLFEKHVPKGDSQVDMRKLYPEMFITPEKYAKMLQALSEQADLFPNNSKKTAKVITSKDRHP